MKIKKNILTLSLILATVVGFAQTPYKLNYPDITIGNKPDGGKIVLNGSNVQFPRIGLGSATDSVLTIVNGVIKKVPRSSITSPTPSLDQVLNVGFTSELPISVGAISAGSGSITSAPTQPTNIVRLSDLSAYQPISSAVTSVNGRTGAVTGLAEASSLATGQTIGANTTGSADKWGGQTGNFSSPQTGQYIYWNGTNFTNKTINVTSPITFDNNTGTWGFNGAAYQTVANLSTDLTASATKYPNVNAVNTGLALKANLSGGNNFVGAQNVKGVLSINPAIGTYPFIQIADNGNLTAFESATAQIGINGSTGRLAFTRGSFTGTINNPTLTANRTWDLPNKTGTFALTSDVSAIGLQEVTSVNNTTTTGANFGGSISTNQLVVNGFGSYVTGVSTIYNDSNNGTVFGTKAGAINDINIVNSMGQGVIKIPTTTRNVVIEGGNLSVNGYVRAVTNDGNENTLVRNTDLSNYALKTPVFSTSGTSATLVSSGRYIPQNASLTIYTLPTTAAVGDVIFINGKGAGGWRISQNTGQVIHGATDTTTGSAGYVGSTARYNSIAIVCVTANTEWIIQSSQGSLTIN